MQLTQYTDYSLRTLIFLGSFPERRCTIAEISKAFGISNHHVMKVVQNLTQNQILTGIRGRSGGLRLAKKPSEIKLGEILRMTESHFNLAECFKDQNNNCPINLTCALKGMLYEAKEQFIGVLDSYTLEDVINCSEGQVQILAKALEPPLVSDKEETQEAKP